MVLSAALYSVYLECQGGYPERFLNAAAEADIPLWDIRHCEASLWCRAAAADYLRLRPVARRAHIRMRVRKKQGLLFRFRRLGLRAGLLCGAVLFFVVLSLLSSRVWVLRVHGNTTVSDDAILDSLKPLGVFEGADLRHVNLPELRLSALQQLPDLIWLTVNQTGSIATVEVQERTPTTPLSANTPANLVAACDGVILHIDTVTGQPMVKAGDAVTRGTLLISGVMDSTVGPQLKHAAGHVLARTTHTLTQTVPLKESVTVVERTVYQPALHVFGWRIPLYASTALEGTPTVSTTYRPLLAADVPLPLGISVTRLAYSGHTPVIRTAEQARALAEQRIAEQLEKLSTSFTLENKQHHFHKTTDAVTVTVRCVGTQELAVESPIL